MAKASIQTINITSFSYKNGEPKLYKGDLLFSVRNMNHVNRDIQSDYDGRSKRLQKALFEDSYNQDLYQDIIDQIEYHLRRQRPNKINIYIGCVLGRHRSVATVCLLQKDLFAKFKRSVINLSHRELE